MHSPEGVVVHLPCGRLILLRFIAIYIWIKKLWKFAYKLHLNVDNSNTLREKFGSQISGYVTPTESI